MDFVLILLAGALAWGAPQTVVCPSELGVTRLYPWPDVPPEMIQSLARLAEREALTSRGPLLTEALARADKPDQVVAQLFKPSPLADVRRYYGPGNWVPDGHALLLDQFGLRALLAKTLVDIADPTLQFIWMVYLGADPSPAVRTRAAMTALRWPEPKRREDYFVRILGIPHPNPAVAQAALAEPQRISPILRLHATTFLMNLQRDEYEPDILRALDTYPERDVLRAWYGDQVIGRRLASMLTKSRTAWIDHDARRGGLFISDVRNKEVRRRWTDALASLATKSDAQGEFALSVLTWSAFGDHINTFVTELFAGVPEEVALARAITAVKGISYGAASHLEFTREALAHRLLLFRRGELKPLPVEWTNDEIDRFRVRVTSSDESGVR